MSGPAYFERVRARAARRWAQLDADPDLAAPWHQLFRQVQSPGHVLSELLQNADDAHATAASVVIEDGELVFSHDGEEFSAEQFESLCSFGRSNKHQLHTIGFRGIGFKSTFSLGDEVRLATPSLSVAYGRRHFTEPVWLERRARPERTEISVRFKDARRRREFEKSLHSWIESPVSLLFLRNVRSLVLADQELRWVSHGVGPVGDSEWFALPGHDDNPYLLVRSAEAAFPDEAIEEIREERSMELEGGSAAFPPCSVDVVLGLEGRLFAFLPTGVVTKLPFAANAPFIQDPARMKIKDPETSPTNRWLLGRVGELAAKTMLHWLHRVEDGAEERCGAYDLLPDVDREETTLEGSCAKVVEEAFDAALGGQPCLVTEDNRILDGDGCAAVPVALFDVWPEAQVAAYFLGGGRAVLSRHVSAANLAKLKRWALVSELERTAVLGVLESMHLPVPASWSGLFALWVFVAEDVVRPAYLVPRGRTAVRIVPVQGKEVLFAASQIVRLGEKQLLQSAGDWEFLANHLLVLNQNWPRFLAQVRRRVEAGEGREQLNEVQAAYATLQALNLVEAADASVVIQNVCREFFSQEQVERDEAVRLARIAAKLGVAVAGDFCYVNRADEFARLSHHILADVAGDLDGLIDGDWMRSHAVHEAYEETLVACTREEWKNWIVSGRSGLKQFVPLVPVSSRLWGREKLLSVLAERGLKSAPSFSFVTADFSLADWDFEPVHWKQWEALAAGDESTWSRVLEHILAQPREYALSDHAFRASHVSTTGSTRSVTNEPLAPAWILKLKDLRCLRDTRGSYREPAELLRRTPRTEAFLDVEPFVRAELDTEATRPFLEALGVRDDTTGAGTLLQRLIALSKAANPPVPEVARWCHRIDQVATRSSTDELKEIRAAFHERKLILQERGGWASASEVFLTSNEEDLPEAAVVHTSIRDLSLWRRIDVSERPSAELALQWLRSLIAGQQLQPDELRRIRSLMARHAVRIWTECAHWLNLEGEWTPVSALAFRLTMRTLVPWKHLFPGIKKVTADLQHLSLEISELPPFARLESLSDVIEERIPHQIRPQSESHPQLWLPAFGSGLQRIVLPDDAETARIRALGECVAELSVQVTPGMEAVPYIRGTPAGTPRFIDALLVDRTLYVGRRSEAGMARPVTQELGRYLGRQDLSDAVKVCFGRSREFIEEYLAENFELADVSSPKVTEQARERRDSDLPGGGTAPGADGTNAPYAHAEAIDSPPVDVQSNDSALDETTPEVLATDPDAAEGEYGAPTRATTTRPRKPAGATLIERFADARRFRADGHGRFFHADGSWLARATEGPFTWELRASNGDLVQYFWPKDHCLLVEPLELDAEVWGLCARSPELYTLLLTDKDGGPVALSGQTALEMRDRGQITLYPASYRLVQEQAVEPGR